MRNSFFHAGENKDNSCVECSRRDRQQNFELLTFERFSMLSANNLICKIHNSVSVPLSILRENLCVISRVWIITKWNETILPGRKGVGSIKISIIDSVILNFIVMHTKWNCFIELNLIEKVLKTENNFVETDLDVFLEIWMRWCY